MHTDPNIARQTSGWLDRRCASTLLPQRPQSCDSAEMIHKIEKSDGEWRAELSDEQYSIMRKKGTEPAFTGQYHDTKTPGVYRCAGCGLELFASTTKFDSGSGWPSFFSPVASENVSRDKDMSHGMVREEVMCGACGSHLGHVFPDGPKPTGLRYCINSACLTLKPNK